MDESKSRRKRSILITIFILSIILMIIRVDWWWWGAKIHPLLFGWLSVPMLYQLFIWLAGTALVFWLCIGVWKNANENE